MTLGIERRLDAGAVAILGKVVEVRRILGAGGVAGA